MNRRENAVWFAVRQGLQQLGWQPGHRGWWVEQVIETMAKKEMA